MSGTDDAARTPAQPSVGTTTDSLIDATVEAISLVEVTANSLESQDIGTIEQGVLKHALKTLWAIHDGLSALPGLNDDPATTKTRAKRDRKTTGGYE